MTSPFQSSDINAFRSNFTSAETDREHLLRCWAHKTCGGCLASYQCSWCPYTWACIPNSYRVPLLAPVYNERICPHQIERWEVRTHPFGCHVSTITSLTAIFSVVSTLILVIIVLFVMVLIRRVRQYSKQHPNWRQYWRQPRRIRGQPDNLPQERDPLLSWQGGSQAEGA